MRMLKTAIDPRSRAGEIRTFHPDILRLLDVFARISRPSDAILHATGGLVQLFNCRPPFHRMWPSEGCMAHPSALANP